MKHLIECRDCSWEFMGRQDQIAPQLVGHETETGHRTRSIVVVRCCGADLVCDDGFLNTCGRCGRDYNGAGQLLAPRSQWGEETGETAADILSGRDEGGEL